MSHVLIVTDDQQAQVLAATLAKASDGPFSTECETALSAALERIARGGVDIILAKLDLPDSSGIATFDQLFARARHIPIMTLQRGAQGYLSKGHYSSSLVPQALRNIIERKAVEEDLYKNVRMPRRRSTVLVMPWSPWIWREMSPTSIR
jgi:DNA-binding NarL/FixJ family response regulator